MSKKIQIISSIIIVIFIYFIKTSFFPNPKEVINENLDKIEKLISFNSTLSIIQLSKKIKGFKKYFSKDVIINIKNQTHHTNNLDSTEKLTQHLAMLKRFLSNLKISFKDRSIHFKKYSAEVTTTLLATGKKISGESIYEGFEVKIYFINADGWIINKIEPIEIIDSSSIN